MEKLYILLLFFKKKKKTISENLNKNKKRGIKKPFF